MQKIMVISDTHDDRDAIRGVMRYLNSFKVDRIIHLGDYYDDADILEQAGYPLIRVPGTWDTAYYPDPEVNNRKFIEIAGWRIFLTHTPESHYNDLADDINRRLSSTAEKPTSSSSVTLILPRSAAATARSASIPGI